jgi:hypothetical protein
MPPVKRRRRKTAALSFFHKVDYLKVFNCPCFIEVI